jgi:hypothetical protein
MPDIRLLDLSGGSNSQINGFELDHNLEISLSGGSELSGDLSADSVVFSISGGSEVSLLGESPRVDINGSGGSWFGLEEFHTDELTFDLSGGSTAKVSVDQILSGNASGGSSVHYSGDPQLGNISKSGGARITKR